MMEAISKIESFVEQMKLKAEKKKQHCDKHQIGYFYSCSECDAEIKQAQERVYQVGILLTQSGIRKRFETACFENFKPESRHDQINFQLAKNYAENFDVMKEEGKNIVMHGGTGTGKNYLAVSIMRQLISLYSAKVKVITAYNLIYSINETYSPNCHKTERQVKQEYLGYDFLVIDEFDLNRGNESDNLQLFDVINDRYEEMLPTAIISNLNREQLEKRVGQRVMSRLLDGGVIMKFTGTDRRKNQVCNGGLR
ncbi:ATP-binding protein [Thiotrichales bacterium 19X7-9]|nr:ATP-binding protein [Thiotrichales bacterium 19X7-9]